MIQPQFYAAYLQQYQRTHPIWFLWSCCTFFMNSGVCAWKGNERETPAQLRGIFIWMGQGKGTETLLIWNHRPKCRCVAHPTSGQISHQLAPRCPLEMKKLLGRELKCRQKKQVCLLWYKCIKLVQPGKTIPWKKEQNIPHNLFLFSK